MATQPIPTNGSLRTAPAIQHTVIAKRAVGLSKRQIARDLGIARKTVDAILESSPVERPDYAASVHSKLIPKALTRIEQVLENDTDTAKYVLDRTIFKPEQSQQYTINGDVQLQQALTLLPAVPGAPAPTGLLSTGPTTLPSSTSSTPDSPSTASTQGSTATEAAANPPGNDIGLSNHTNFSAFSTEQLRAELARREGAQAQVIDAVVVEP